MEELMSDDQECWIPLSICPMCSAQNYPVVAMKKTQNFNCRDCGWWWIENHILEEAN
jgi:hypothetical protein